MTICKTLLIAFIGIVSIMFFASCSKDGLKKCNESSKTPCQEDATRSNIRIKNTSDEDYCNLIVIGADGKTVNYGSVRRGEITCYNFFDEIYSYAFVRLSIGGEEFVMQPIDYVGATQLGAGKFTYSISFDKKYKDLSIKMTKD